MKKVLLTLGTILCLVGCFKSEDGGYGIFKNQSRINEAKHFNLNKAMVSCVSTDVGGKLDFKNETFVLTDGVWTPIVEGKDACKDYLSIKGSNLEDPTDIYKQMASEASKKDKEAESTYSTSYLATDVKCTALFEINIISTTVGFYQRKEYVFNQCGFLTSYNEEETNKGKIEVTIIYTIAEAGQ